MTEFRVTEHRVQFGQSKKMSFLESCVNMGIGCFIAYATQIIVFPWFDIEISHAENLAIVAIFTVVSIIRSYVLRRAFNWWHHRKEF